MAPAPIWSDARTFNGRAWRGAVDGLIGGIPCQPHSLAGRKGGQNDERDLWSDARRIIVQSGAWFVLIENVSGMLSAGSDEIAGAERVCRDLHKLGFSVEGGLFTASEVGAPHQRERVFILAVADRNGEHGDGTRIEREGRRRQSSNSSDRLADANSKRLERIGADFGAQRWPDAGRSAGLCGRATLVNAESIRCGERGAKSELRSGRATVAISSRAVGDPARCCEQNIDDRNGASRQCVKPVSGAAGGNFSWHHTDRSGEIGEVVEALRPIFPPGPEARRKWGNVISRAPELEPAFRRVADGLATRMDIARVDRLRMLGNGVVPLEAAYALRTLITRLAGRGSAGAARLVRMMEGIEA
ncbi:DNA cytosine methyltransferase [Agrobacterium sp.]|uniref:DNA cytosine methyltransferase n=1 Tax=Agrobacterium sp. TaxID=361 RepID=UPI0034327FA6